ncbi:MAG: hypothetical protein ABI867_33720 [Kofleriaceae bacterium]
MRVTVVLTLLVGCSFEPPPAIPGDAVSDTTPEPDTTAEVGCFSAWRDHSVRVGTPAPLVNVNSNTSDRDPFLTADEQTLLFGARGTATTDQIFQATRSSATADFGPPQVVMELSTDDGDESKAVLRGDGLEVFVATTRANGAGLSDLWTSTRLDLQSQFTAFANVPGVNDDDQQHDPELSADGLHLYFAQSSLPQHIVVAARTSLTADFDTPVTVIDSGVGDADPSVSPDERILLFSSNRTGSGFGGGNIWYATRNSTTEPFGTPAALPGINGNTNDGDPVMSHDGCRVYFATDRGITGFDLFVADVVR